MGKMHSLSSKITGSRRMSLARGLLMIVSVFLTPALAVGAESIAIVELSADPNSYHLQMVTLEGTVHDIERLVPYEIENGTMCYGAYTFRLEDQTGSVKVSVLGVCGVPMIREPDVTEGDCIMLRAQVLSPEKLAIPREQDGEEEKEANAPELEVIANAITRIK